MPDVWITKWVDYASKYGIGYILSNGCIGVYFNDSTKVILMQDGNVFDYVTRRTPEKNEDRTTHSLQDYPDDLKKKVTLLRHFKTYMQSNAPDERDGASVGESNLQPHPQRAQAAVSPGQAPFVKKWTRNKHAIMFQLSNKMMHVIFQDKTEAVLSSATHTVAYMNKTGQVVSYPYANGTDVPNPELSKRLKYIKDILTNLLGTRNVDLAADVQ